MVYAMANNTILNRLFQMAFAIISGLSILMLIKIVFPGSIGVAPSIIVAYHVMIAVVFSGMFALWSNNSRRNASETILRMSLLIVGISNAGMLATIYGMITINL